MMRRILRQTAAPALALAPTLAFAHPDPVPREHAGFLAGLLLVFGV